MKRMLMAVAAVVLAAGAVQADWGGKGSAPAMPVPQIGGPNTLLGPSEPYNGVAPDPYGLNPRLKKLFRLGGGSRSQYYPQMGYTQSGPAYNPTGYPPGNYGPAQGTLAFPHHNARTRTPPKVGFGFISFAIPSPQSPFALRPGAGTCTRCGSRSSR